VAHDDRRTFEALDDVAEIVEGCGDGCVGDDLGLFAQRLHFDLESGYVDTMTSYPFPRQ
jgi:hypothetical protein